MTESQITNPPLSTEPQPINVEIQRSYAKEQSYKVPHGNQVFRANGQPETSTEININSQPLEKGLFEVTLHLTLTTKLEQRRFYQDDAQYAVIIKTNSNDEKLLTHLMNTAAPTLLSLPVHPESHRDSDLQCRIPSGFSTLLYMDFGRVIQTACTGKGHGNIG